MSILLLQGRISQVVLLKLKVKNSFAGRDPIKIALFPDRRINPYQRSILINRESGTGKQMFIRYLPSCSPERPAFFVKVLALKVT